jgi:membrane-associated phospholipid phosphatase
MVAAGLAAPLLRKRLSTPPVVAQAVAYGAPVGLAIAVRRSPKRDVAVCCLQMWAYLAAYKSPHDDEEAQSERVRVDYPIACDRAMGFGELPSVRLQRRLARPPGSDPQWRTLDRVLVWAHWSWFAVPHGAAAYVLVRHPERFPRAAAMTYAVFNVGAVFYWLVPTAPPWYAAELQANGSGERPQVRRMMVEFGEDFWRDGWASLYSVFGGNPLAAMPSLHFATSVMAALLLAECGTLPGALGTVYAATLGFALVYLGEHYVIDLLAGAALTVAIRRAAPRVAPAFGALRRAIGSLEEMAHATA